MSGARSGPPLLPRPCRAPGEDARGRGHGGQEVAGSEERRQPDEEPGTGVLTSSSESQADGERVPKRDDHSARAEVRPMEVPLHLDEAEPAKRGGIAARRSPAPGEPTTARAVDLDVHPAARAQERHGGGELRSRRIAQHDDIVRRELLPPPAGFEHGRLAAEEPERFGEVGVVVRDAGNPAELRLRQEEAPVQASGGLEQRVVVPEQFLSLT
jgi:hypothetical protein